VGKTLHDDKELLNHVVVVAHRQARSNYMWKHDEDETSRRRSLLSFLVTILEMFMKSVTNAWRSLLILSMDLVGGGLS
jgi:hypothetical protein